MEFCHACKELGDGSSNLCSWCSNNIWVGIETERMHNLCQTQTIPDMEKLRVRELELYLKEHGLTTICRKPDKVKAISRCHHYRHNKDTEDELSNANEDDVESENERKVRQNNNNRRKRQ